MWGDHASVPTVSRHDLLNRDQRTRETEGIRERPIVLGNHIAGPPLLHIANTIVRSPRSPLEPNRTGTDLWTRTPRDDHGELSASRIHNRLKDS